MKKQIKRIFLNTPPKKAKGVITLANLVKDVFVNNLNEEEIGIFVYQDLASVDGSVQLVFAKIDAAGNPDTTTGTVSFELPCPPFCGKKITVIVE